MTVDSHSDERTRRFRWRVLPAAILMIFGGLLIAVGVASLGIAAFAALYPVALEGAAVKSVIDGLSIFGGILLILSGVWCFRGRWQRAIIGVIAGYLYLVTIHLVVSPDM